MFKSTPVKKSRSRSDKMLLFVDKPLHGHLEDRENYLVFTQTISRFERKISFWRNVSKNTMHCRARSGRILATTRGD